MNSILCLDTSMSMKGPPLEELQQAVGIFLLTALRTGVITELPLERIGIVEFGEHIRLLHGLTENYKELWDRVMDLRAVKGSTPMAQGLKIALDELNRNGKKLIIQGAITLHPRVILITDGVPDDRDEVLEITRELARQKYPVACVGTAECDMDLLRQIARMTGGMVLKCNSMQEVGAFFLEQMILALFIMEFAQHVEDLYSKEKLRQYMHDKGVDVSGPELDNLYQFLKNIATENTPPAERRSGSGNRSSPNANRVSSSGGSKLATPPRDPEPELKLTPNDYAHRVKDEKPTPSKHASKHEDSIYENFGKKVADETNSRTKTLLHDLQRAKNKEDAANIYEEYLKQLEKMVAKRLKEVQDAKARRVKDKTEKHLKTEDYRHKKSSSSISSSSSSSKSKSKESREKSGSEKKSSSKKSASKSQSTKNTSSSSESSSSSSSSDSERSSTDSD